jgi:hypothetical protein
VFTEFKYKFLLERGHKEGQEEDKRIYLRLIS